MIVQFQIAFNPTDNPWQLGVFHGFFLHFRLWRETVPRLSGGAYTPLFGGCQLWQTLFFKIFFGLQIWRGSPMLARANFGI
jgi:hypothetical protein